jgi:uncharacterized protein with HEPN domain
MKDTLKLLHDMLQAIDTIEGYATSNYAAFLADERTQDAIMFNLVILGEAANRISQEFQEEHPEIPWSSMIGTRNIIVHGYDQVKLQIVWDIVSRDLGSLKSSLLQLKMDLMS